MGYQMDVESIPYPIIFSPRNSNRVMLKLDGHQLSLPLLLLRVHQSRNSTSFTPEITHDQSSSNHPFSYIFIQEHPKSTEGSGSELSKAFAVNPSRWSRPGFKNFWTLFLRRLLNLCLIHKSRQGSEFSRVASKDVSNYIFSAYTYLNPLLMIVTLVTSTLLMRVLSLNTLKTVAERISTWYNSFRKIQLDCEISLPKNSTWKLLMFLYEFMHERGRYHLTPGGKWWDFSITN